MFAALMISAHCADSARMVAPNSSGELPFGLLAPAATPKETVLKIHADVIRGR